MKSEKVKEMLDSCYMAKRILDMLPKLPEGYLKKETAKHDGRVTYVTVTKEGKMIFEKYNKDYFQKLALCLNHVSNDEADCMIQTIEKFYEIMCEGREK